ncbi:MAG: 50S ribosomal protein L20 [Candidatus Omnitrophota bacterium]
MARVRTGPATLRRKKKIFKLAKGQRGSRSKLLTLTKESIKQSLLYMYRDRRNKKRDFRRLWITRIGIACKNAGIRYSSFMNALKKENILLDRKMLAELAVNNKLAFKELVKIAKDKT